jgi:hypothetical protein
MDSHYSTLRTIYEIVKDDPDPTSYPCKPAQIIVRQFLPWDTILVNIRKLDEEGMVSLQQYDRFTIVRLTALGMKKARANGSSAIRKSQD